MNTPQADAEPRPERRRFAVDVVLELVPQLKHSLGLGAAKSALAGEQRQIRILLSTSDLLVKKALTRCDPATIKFDGHRSGFFGDRRRSAWDGDQSRALTAFGGGHSPLKTLSLH